MAFVSFAPHSCLLLLLLLCAVACSSGGEPERKKVAVEGVVYCKVCARDPNNSFHHVDATNPLAGAVVWLQCNNTRRSWAEDVKTGGAGEFLLTPKRVTSWGAHKCRLFLVSSPRNDCIAPTTAGSPWKVGFALTKTNATLTLQYYSSAHPLLYYYYWPDCF